MPRDGSGIYTYPPGSPGIPDTTIESAKYNGYIADVQQDLNLPRPIVAGGTGATNATAARDNLDAEVSTQVVTNYDTHVWEAGSFKSAIGAVGAPNASQNFSGICHLFDATSCFIEARAYEGNQERYFRRKYGGTWFPWTSAVALNGPVTINDASGAFLFLNRPLPFSGAAGIQSSVNNLARWSLHLGTSTAETGSDVGSDFLLFRCNDSGSPQVPVLTIPRNSGIATFSNDLRSNGAIGTSTHFVAQGGIQFGGAAAFGVYQDSTSVALRPPGAGTVNIQSANGGATYASFATTGLSVTGNLQMLGTAIVGAKLIQTTIDSGVYQWRVHNTTAREYGIAVSGGTMYLGIDDISGSKVVAQFTPWNGTYSTLILPNMTTTAVAPNCAVSTSTGTFIFSSSRRYKKDIQPLEQADADKLLRLDAVTYQSTSPVDDPDRRWYGFVAEDVDLVDPLLVYREYKREDLIDERDGEDGPIKRRVRDGAIKVPDQVDYTRITVLAVAKVQEQQKRIDAQEDRIAELIARIEALEAKVA